MAMHKNPHPNRVAEAPFNFVPLPEAVFTPEPVNCTYGEYAPQRHSGWIDLQIKAETPLYVRCAPPTDRAQPDNAGDNPHRRPFFHHGNPNLPVLPGSSIRGMTRALFEVLTYGKMSYAGRQLVYRAVGDPGSVGDLYRSQLLGRDQAKGQTNNGRKPTPRYNYPSPNVRGGYLEINDNKRYIRPACEIKGETFVHVDYKTVNWAECNQQEYYKDIYVEPVERTNSQNRGFARIELILAVTPRVERRPMKGLEKATLVVSGHMGNLRNPAPHDKHMHCAIYEPDPDNNKLIEIKEELWELYYEDSEMHRGIKTRKIRSSGDPLFYLLDDNGELVFFGPTLMFRVPYPHSISDFIPGDLKDSQTVDLTEAVFAALQFGAGYRLKMPVRPDDNKFYGDVSPSILGSPKLTAFQQYLTQDQPDDKKSFVTTVTARLTQP